MDLIHERPNPAAVLREHVLAEMVEAGGGMLPWAASEVAHAVAAYACSAPEYSSSQSLSIRRDHLGLLTSRALHAVGEGSLARRVLLRATGTVRPTEWLTWRNQVVWSFDLSRLTARDEDCLELVFYRALDAALDTLAGMWDVTSGRGVLALCRLGRAAARLAGSESSVAQTQVASEIRHRCAWRMKAHGERRGWATTPLVLDMDGIST